MANQIEPPVGPPLGFPKCPKCTYLRNGPPRTCLACAAQTFEGIAPNACPVCNQMLTGETCPNWLCTDPARRISRIRAIAYLSGPLRRTILTYKYDGKHGWSLIFGRLLVAWLDQNGRDSPPDLIIANPTFLGDGAAVFGHTERVLQVAEKEDVLGEWPLDVADPRVIVKTRETPKSAGNGAAAKRSAAAELRDALTIPDPRRVVGKRILVYDDVCTTGSQLDAVAAVLIDEGGAADVEGIVLARAPWRPRT